MKKKTIRILNVEDEDVDHAALLRAVTAKGLPYSVDRAGTVKKAGESLERKNYDIVLLDYMLPDGTALDILEKLKGIPSILITGAGNEMVAVKAIKGGADDYLVKDTAGLYLELLPLAIAKALHTRTLQKEKDMAEAALREKEHILSESQRVAHIGSWTYDIEGRITWTDETYRIYGVSPDTFTPNAESIMSLVHPEDRSAMQAWTDACLAGAKPGELLFRIIWPDGTVHFLSGCGALKYDDENRPGYMTGTVQDVTERKQAESRLTEQIEELRRWHDATLGREMRILELKREVNELLRESGRPPRYPSAEGAEYDR